MLTEAEDKLAAIRRAAPAEGLFAEKDFLISPESFAIDAKFEKELEQLGHRLFVFQRACNQLYHQSVKGKQPAWVAQYLDAGKPRELIEFSRRKEFREANGGENVIGGAAGMLEGFQSVLPKGGDIAISREAATYRPEMEWIAAQLNEKNHDSSWEVFEAENYEPRTGRSVYRFFELFDLPNLPRVRGLMEAAADGRVSVTPPFKPYLEEKSWFALFWLQPLREFWRRELGEKYFIKLQEVIPYTWLLDPTPLPQHAVIPRLEIHDWREAEKFSQKERDLLLKVSGFSPLAWGSRGVALGQDLPHSQWQQQIEHALATFEQSPTILQRFHKGRLVEQRYWDAENAELKTMRGRVRLCPYYFVESDKVQLRGALATVCTADKKLLHGMRDAILTPTHVVDAGQ